MNYETQTVRVTYKFTHLHESGVVFCVTSIKRFVIYFADMVFTGVYCSIWWICVTPHITKKHTGNPLASLAPTTTTIQKTEAEAPTIKRT